MLVALDPTLDLQRDPDLDRIPPTPDMASSGSSILDRVRARRELEDVPKSLTILISSSRVVEMQDPVGDAPRL